MQETELDLIDQMRVEMRKLGIIIFNLGERPQWRAPVMMALSV